MYHNLFVSVSGAHPCSGNAALKIIDRERTNTGLRGGKEKKKKKKKRRKKKEEKKGEEGERRAGCWSESAGEMKLERKRK